MLNGFNFVVVEFSGFDNWGVKAPVRCMFLAMEREYIY